MCSDLACSDSPRGVEDTVSEAVTSVNGGRARDDEVGEAWADPPDRSGICQGP